MEGDMMEAAGVRWSDWEPGALARAGAEGKLIFLDIGNFCRLTTG